MIFSLKNHKTPLDLLAKIMKLNIWKLALKLCRIILNKAWSIKRWVNWRIKFINIYPKTSHNQKCLMSPSSSLCQLDCPEWVKQHWAGKSVQQLRITRWFWANKNPKIFKIFQRELWSSSNMMSKSILWKFLTTEY